MNHLNKLLSDYQESVPPAEQNEVAFVAGIASLATSLADHSEAEWGRMLDELMEKDMPEFIAECAFKNPQLKP